MTSAHDVRGLTGWKSARRRATQHSHLLAGRRLQDRVARHAAVGAAGSGEAVGGEARGAGAAYARVRGVKCCTVQFCTVQFHAVAALAVGGGEMYTRWLCCVVCSAVSACAHVCADGVCPCCPMPHRRQLRVRVPSHLREGGGGATRAPAADAGVYRHHLRVRRQLRRCVGQLPCVSFVPVVGTAVAAAGE